MQALRAKQSFMLRVIDVTLNLLHRAAHAEQLPQFKLAWPNSKRSSQ